MVPYQPRPVLHHGIRRHGDWRLKVYSIHYGDEPFALEPYEPAVAKALASLPAPARTAGRPGVGFVIVHRGRGANYIVLGWWDRENELPLRVFVNEGSAPGGWRPAQASESVCVWDLELVWFERNAYVATMLAGAESGGEEAYLARIHGDLGEIVLT